MASFGAKLFVKFITTAIFVLFILLLVDAVKLSKGEPTVSLLKHSN